MSSCLITDEYIEHQEYSVHEIIKYKNGIKIECEDFIAEEVPIALIYNGISHAVMMATPSNLENFAIGFSLSERIINNIKEIKNIDVKSSKEGIEVYIELQNRAFMMLKDQRRQLVGRTGCGLCGIEHLKQAMKPVNTVPDTQRMYLSVINQSLNLLHENQELANRTGCTHAAVWLNEHGELAAIYEDVGRHVALDKLIGARAKYSQLTKGAILITSRASYEIVQKATSVDVEILFAVSAPTALAINLAEESGLTLIGFCREGRATIYTNKHRIIN
ncbi:formate dehydrogenase accessory sulfurtransferase FdhD [Photobacterium angustum]|uniref:Sulfur carrier protein FdhD n=1 Tax=Photobacterium angustum TaxID=661 RepID=A0A855SAP3_PHOAN|nr:formate dehydrogenase accessory sulfurtransferase FdhD [Photobacterium angustum]KJF80731.1 formate dehydrogenase [Photobacterium damselae subsp. damselae]KJG44187.1 formate dehydrogenase [Photobacterium angustum]PSX06788.1 formate dehydrogenase accessory sulfurtransferase FdhD [Photobacterium angustum]PSX14687.1 formate dehydrogenase accessory sulfurtransferase FdhD [Photobacterium angustum]PSX23220.1 formate dehydrogenase accessory sulfurtransferase FdhD [Photobacterium angustum]